MMNTRVIDHQEDVKDIIGLRIRKTPCRNSLIRRFRNYIELSEWEERFLQHGREIDVFCWMLAAGTTVLLLPVCFLVMKS